MNNLSKSSNAKVILAVDDMAVILNSLKAILQKYYHVVAVNSTTLAAQYLMNHYVDLLLLDIGMPEEDGITFARELKNAPTTKDIPIIFLTGHATQDTVTTAYYLGAADYIVKPINEQILFDKIGKILGLPTQTTTK